MKQTIFGIDLESIKTKNEFEQWRTFTSFYTFYVKVDFMTNQTKLNTKVKEDEKTIYLKSILI